MHPIAASDLSASLQRACAGLAGLQQRSGLFPGDIEQGTAATSQTVIVLARLGALDPDFAEEALRWLAASSLPDGSMPSYPGAGFASFADTCCAYAAFVAAGRTDQDPRAMRLRACIEARGGLAAADALTQVFLALAGLVSPALLPKPQIGHVLVPAIERHVGRTFVVYYGTTLTYILPGILHGLAHPNAAALGAWESAARQRIIDFLLARQNPEGNWAGSQWLTSMAAACLYLLGMPTHHPAIARALDSLRRLRRRNAQGAFMIPLNAEVWNTAMALRVLHDAGAPGLDEVHRLGVDALLAAQSDLAAPGDWINARANMPRSGGWSFESGNLLLSDTDTTAMVLWTLSAWRQKDEVARALNRGAAWLRAMQNPDGSWGAFAYGHRTPPVGPLFRNMPTPPTGLLDTARFFLKPPIEFTDHGTADLTSRVIGALGMLGTSADSPMVQRAVAFIRAQRDGDVWWGRWTTNYLAATGFILHGLRHAGVDLRADWVQRAVAWVLGHQNSDGGFGEQNESYANPALAGQGPSNAYLTGIVAQGLCCAGLGRTEAVSRAARYLMDTQRDDGLWTERQAVQTVVPPEQFYKNFVNTQTAPIAALARVGRALRGDDA